MAANVARITGDVTERVVITDEITVTHVAEDVAAWATVDVSTTRAASDVTTNFIVIILLYCCVICV